MDAEKLLERLAELDAAIEKVRALLGPSDPGLVRFMTALRRLGHEVMGRDPGDFVGRLKCLESELIAIAERR